MASKEDLIFAQIAIKKGVLTKEQATTCLAEVKRRGAGGKTVSIADVVVAGKLLDKRRAQLLAVLSHFQITRATDMACKKVLVARGYVSEADVDAALATQRQRFKEQRQVCSAIDILIDDGLLTDAQAAEVEHAVGQGNGKGELLVAARPAPGEDAPAEAPEPEEDAPPADVDGEMSSKDVRNVNAGGAGFAVKIATLPTGRCVSCVLVSGRLDTAGAPAFQKVMRDILAQEGDEAKYIIMDLASVGYLASSGVGIIAAVWREASMKGGAFGLAEVPEKLWDVLSLVGLDTVASFPSLSAALRAIGKV